MIKDNYIYHEVHSYAADFLPENGSTYIYAYSKEGRSYNVDNLMKMYKNQIDFIQIQESRKDRIEISSKEYNLRSSKSIRSLFDSFHTSKIYIDVSGMNNRISASLLKHTLSEYDILNTKNISVIYAEPDTYKIGRFRSEGVFNDLSEQIEGVEPLPGFASIIPDEIDNIIFVALLGFEGGRFMHIIENIQPPKDNIIPVIGVPGFRIEYPFVAYWGNRRPITETNTWRNIEYVSANSVIDIYTFLSKLITKYPLKKIKVAPIGTKPHAIGAILFAIKYPNRVELVYDNPIRNRKTPRTDGVGKIIECDVTKLIKEK